MSAAISPIVAGGRSTSGDESATAVGISSPVPNEDSGVGGGVAAPGVPEAVAQVDFFFPNNNIRCTTGFLVELQCREHFTKKPYLITCYSVLQGASGAQTVFTRGSEEVVVPMLLDSEWTVKSPDLNYAMIPLAAWPSFRGRGNGPATTATATATETDDQGTGTAHPNGIPRWRVVPLKLSDVEPEPASALKVVGFEDPSATKPPATRWDITVQSVDATKVVFEAEAVVGAPVLDSDGFVRALNLPYDNEHSIGLALRADVLLQHSSNRDEKFCVLPVVLDFCGQQEKVPKLRALLTPDMLDGEQTERPRIVLVKGPRRVGKSAVVAEALKYFPKDKLLFVAVNRYPDLAALLNLMEEIDKSRDHSRREATVADAAVKLRQYISGKKGLLFVFDEVYDLDKLLQSQLYNIVASELDQGQIVIVTNSSGPIAPDQLPGAHHEDVTFFTPDAAAEFLVGCRDGGCDNFHEEGSRWHQLRTLTESERKGLDSALKSCYWTSDMRMIREVGQRVHEAGSFAKYASSREPKT